MKLDTNVLERFPKLKSIAERIGGTDFVEIPTPAGSARIFAKLEFQNPFGTIKDRVALAMIHRLLKETPELEGPILEYTGGSLGIALASICEELGLPLTIVASHVSEALDAFERKGVCRIERVDPSLGFWQVMERAQEMAAASSPSQCRYHFLYQHQNEANLSMHREVTGPEILAQLKEKRIDACDAWIASIGTGGSLIGVYQALRGAFPDLLLVATSPAELPYGSENPPNGLPKFAGSGGLGCGRKQSFVHPFEERFFRHFKISLTDAKAECERFKNSSGFSIGSSSGANLLAARETAMLLGPGKVVVTVFPSAI